MSVDGIANVQARIAEIQQHFVSPLNGGSGSSSGSGTASFADLLSAAASMTTDGTASDGTSTGSGSLSNTLTQLLGGATSGTSGTGSASSSLADVLKNLESANGIGTSTGTGTPVTGGNPAANQAFLQNALAQNGDAYVYGASANPADPHPKAFDCSELVKWAGARAGVTIPDVAQNQYLWLKNQGKLIPVEQAIQTPGALLFSFSSEPGPGNMYPAHAHVAISLGNGKTIEARGHAYGVGIFHATPQRFNYAGVVPGLTA